MPDVREFDAVVEEAEQAAQAGNFVLAGRRLRDALGLQEAALGADHPDLASTLNNLAVVCETLGQFDDAERFYRRASAIASAALPPTDPLVVTSGDNLKHFCRARGRPLEDWPGLGALEPHAPAVTPPAAAPPAGRMPVPEPPAAARPVRVTPGGSAAASRPMRAMAATATLAIVGALVAATLWRGAPPVPTPPAAVPPASTPATPDRRVAAAPAREAATAPAAVRPTPALPAPAGRPSPPPAVGGSGSVRLVVTELCSALSTNGTWRCVPLGAVASPGRVAYYTRIASPRPLRIEHVWYRGAALRQRVTLSVGASPSTGYRTFSRQTLTPGAWRVELRAAGGAVLHEATFEVR